MLAIQNALMAFYKQFAPNVFITQAIDPMGVLFPRIVFNYALTRFLDTTLFTAQIFSRDLSTLESMLIIDKIEEAIPDRDLIDNGTFIEIPSGEIPEYWNYHINEWVIFDLANWDAITRQHLIDFPPNLYPDKPFKWRKTEGEIEGMIWLKRPSGTFITQQSSDDTSMVIHYVSIEATNLN